MHSSPCACAWRFLTALRSHPRCHLCCSPSHLSIIDNMSTTDPAQQVGPRPALLLAVSTQQHLLSELFTVLQATSSAPNADALPALHAGLVQSSERLDQLSAELKVHQAAYSEMLAKQKKAKELEDEIRSIIKELHGAKVDLEEVVTEGAKVRESIERSEEGESFDCLVTVHCRVLVNSSRMISSETAEWNFTS